MFKACEFYYYNELYLDAEVLNKLGIEKTNQVGLITLLSNYAKIMGINDNGDVFQYSKTTIQNKILNSEQEHFYCIRNNMVIIYPIKIYYGIKNNQDKVVAVYDSKRIRNIKLNEVLINSIHVILADIQDSSEIVENYQKQMKLKKLYNNLEIK